MVTDFSLDPNPDKTKRLNGLEIIEVDREVNDQPFGVSKVFMVNIDDDILEPKEYRELVTKLRQADNTVTYELHITSWGGLLSTAMLIVDALICTKAKTKAVIHTAASAATLIAFACDEVEYTNTSTIMVHNFSVTQAGKGSEIRAKAEYDARQFSMLCNKLYTGILTSTEIKQLQEDKDIWMTGEDLQQRMTNLNWKSPRAIEL